MPVPTFYRVRTVTTGLAGGPYLTTMNFNAESGATAEDAVTMVEAFWVGARSEIQSAARINIDSIVQKVDTATGNIVAETSAPTGEITGNNGSAAEWTAKQGLIAWQSSTFVSGKRLQGRTFIFGVNASSGEQVPVALYRNNLSLAANSLIVDSTAAEVQLLAVRRPNEITGAPGIAEYVTGAIVRPYWAMLRSRRQ